MALLVIGGLWVLALGLTATDLGHGDLTHRYRVEGRVAHSSAAVRPAPALSATGRRRH